MYNETVLKNDHAAVARTEIGATRQLVDIVCLVSSGAGKPEERHIRVQLPETREFEALPGTSARDVSATTAIETAIASIFPSTGKKQGKLDILYVCDGSLESTDISDLMFPVYRLARGDLVLHDVSRARGRAKFDMIVVAHSDTKSPGSEALRKAAHSALRLHAPVTMPTGLRLFSKRPDPVVPLSPGRAAA